MLRYLLGYNIIMNVTTFLSEVKLELSKVVWPKRDEVTRLTLIVIAISAMVGVYLGGVDYMFTSLLSSLLLG